uniref:Fibrillar collagen NC1 domain-containing protein n=1 Tax=Macrostomum lignano TaxID=282301 RepID=A0A1I8FIN0_9PLAT
RHHPVDAQSGCAIQVLTCDTLAPPSSIASNSSSAQAAAQHQPCWHRQKIALPDAVGFHICDTNGGTLWIWTAMKSLQQPGGEAYKFLISSWPLSLPNGKTNWNEPEMSCCFEKTGADSLPKEAEQESARCGRLLAEAAAAATAAQAASVSKSPRNCRQPPVANGRYSFKLKKRRSSLSNTVATATAALTFVRGNGLLRWLSFICRTSIRRPSFLLCGFHGCHRRPLQPRRLSAINDRSVSAGDFQTLGGRTTYITPVDAVRIRCALPQRRSSCPIAPAAFQSKCNPRASAMASEPTPNSRDALRRKSPTDDQARRWRGDCQICELQLPGLETTSGHPAASRAPCLRLSPLVAEAARLQQQLRGRT